MQIIKKSFSYGGSNEYRCERDGQTTVQMIVWDEEPIDQYTRSMYVYVERQVLGW